MQKRVLSFLSIVLLQIGLLTGLSPALVRAAADTCVWTGGGSDNNFSTAANWSGCDNSTTPEAGDTLEFPTNITDRAPVNDMTADTSFAAINFTGATSSDSGYTISGNAFQVTGGITDTMTGTSVRSHTISANITFTGAQTLAVGTGSITLSGTISLPNTLTITGSGNPYVGLEGVISGSGSIVNGNPGYTNIIGENTSWSGNITQNAGTLSMRGVNSFGTNAGTTTIASGASLAVTVCGTTSPTSIDENMTLTGPSSNPTTTSKLTVFQSICGAGGGGGFNTLYGVPVSMGKTVDITGDVTLGSDITVESRVETLKFSGALAGAYKPILKDGNGGKLVIAGSPNAWTSSNGDYTSTKVTQTLSDSQPSDNIGVYGNSEIVVTGTRGSVGVDGGTLKGTGTIGDLYLYSGTVAPGTSPGCLTSGALAYTGGTLDIEIAGTTVCTQYDQQIVTGTVSLGTATTLNVSFLNSFIPAQGNTFTIINNDGSDAVTGTFSGLAQGATLTSGGVTFTISYTGGDGNDVVLTASTVPATPDTGAAPVQSTSIILVPVIAALLTAIGLSRSKKYSIK